MKEENFKLTKSQQVLKEKFIDFMNGSERIFLLTGKPGVGKTTMTKICLSEHIKLDIENATSGDAINVAGITLAHQAKNVLGEFVPNVFTFAKAYGMKEVLHDDGSRSFGYDKYAEDFPIGESELPVFVHDEVSQYTEEMLKVVLERTSMFSKIIFIGDKAQLPPIDPEGLMEVDADSPVFDLDIPDNCKQELTERVRQAEGNPILDLSDIIREEIFGNKSIGRVSEAIRKSTMVNGIGFDFISYNKLNEDLKGKDNLNCCVIAFRKTSVHWFNNDIRKALLDNPKDILIEGDIICMLDNYYHKEGDEVTYVLENSQVFRLGKVYSKNIIFSDGKKRHKVASYVANIIGQKSKQLIIPTREGQIQYQKILKKLSEECNLGKNKWENFWNVKKKFCDCTYGYAITAYKSQGSTYDTVYVDINDILLTRPLTPKRKLQTIYTAITRAKYNVKFLKAKP